MKDLIDKYIGAHSRQWAASTQRSEKSRLRKALIENINSSGRSYSRLTTIIRLNHFYEWAIKNGYTTDNPYKDYIKNHKRDFRYVYERKPARYSYEEVLNKIDQIKDAEIKAHALEILKNGLRFSESLQRKGSTVVGKGSKPRKVFGPINECKVSYHKLYRALKKLDLKPHDLRKAFASRLVNKGLNEFDLCKVMGWESIETAKSYVAPKKDRELSDLINN